MLGGVRLKSVQGGHDTPNGVRGRGRAQPGRPMGRRDMSYDEMDSLPPEWDDDPVAQKTDWIPKKPGGASFRTHGLERLDATRMEFRITRGAKLFCWLFIGAGVAVPVAFFAGAMGQSGALDSQLVVACVGIVFTGAGLGMQYFMGRPRVFDKPSGSFWIGRKQPDRLTQPAESDSRVPLEEIYAVQLISEYVRGNKSSFHSYELNLVLRNGRRVNVIDHGGLARLRADADTLGQFLELPVWDAT